MTRRCAAALLAALTTLATPLAATPAQDLQRAYDDLQTAYRPADYLKARNEAQRYLAVNGPHFTAAFVVAMADCMLHPHRPSNAAAFNQLVQDYVIAGPKRLDVNRAVRDCTSPPPPPPPPPQAGVSTSGLTARPSVSLNRPLDDVPPPRHPPAPPPPRVVAAPVVAPPAPAALPASVEAANAYRRQAYLAARCRDPFVWRDAFRGDRVCVMPQVRDDAAADNAHAAERRDPAGAYGPMTCVQGYVWRAARDGDAVCVVPSRRDQAVADNAAAASRRLQP